MWRMAKRGRLIVMIAVSIAILLSAFGLSVTANGSTDGTTFKVIANITVGSNPEGIAYDPSNGYIYVADHGSDTVSVINGTTVIATIPVGPVSGPTGVAYDPSNGYIYVTNWGSNTVSVINGTTVIATIPVGSWPAGVAYDPSNGYIYVTNTGSNTVSVINGANNTVIATIPVGSWPWGVAYNPSNGYIYVTNFGSGTVSVISTSTQVTNTPPSSSSLTVLVYNVLGRPATTVPGVVFGVLYNSSGFSEVAYMNSSGYLNFYGVSPGTYTLEVYHYPNTGFNFTEYWGGMTVNLQPGSNFVTFYRHEPWIYNLQSSVINGSIVVTVTVNGTVTSPTPGEIELWVTNNPSFASPYSPSNVTYVTINPGLNTFNLTYPASQAGTYYVYAALLTYINTYTVTDQWSWTATTIIQPPTPPTLPQNYQAVLNLLNGQQYFGVPHVYQGDNGTSFPIGPTNKWPVYYGPNNASQYWLKGHINSDQPVLELVPGPMSGGAMFWSENYSGGSITITIQATASIVWVGTPFQVYLFLKPTMWGISPQYNYTIPYKSVYPSPVASDVISPQSSTSYLIIQWNPFWRTTATLNGATGQWNVWVVSNPSGNNASFGPYPSPNLGDEGVGWDGIGTGYFQPRPGDRINITVTYDPSTNTLSGVAYDMNTGQSASFTLNLSNYFTPPSSGNYVFGVGAATLDYGGNGALLYVAMMGNVKSPSPSPTYYSVNFTEVGLPPGTTWNVTLNGVTKASSSSSIIFTVPNGEYNYSVASPILVNGVEYVATEPSGTVTVNNNNVTVTVQYVPTTPPSPSLSSLSVKVFNVLGRLATTVPGVVFGVLYNSSGFKEVAYMNSSGYLNFNNISPGTYTLEVYHYPNTGLNLTEYWGSETIDVQPGYNTATFTRDEPWIYNLQAVENGTGITINVTVYNPLNAILHGRLYIWVTTSPQTANPSEPTINASITIWLGLSNFTYYYPTTQKGTYYIYAALLIYNRTQLITTDQWNWTAVMYQLTVIIINPYGTSGTWQFKLYKSNNYFQQGQIVGTQSITFQQEQTNTKFSFDLTPGVYEYIISGYLVYSVVPSTKGFIDLTHNEVIYLYIYTSTAPTLNLDPIGLSDTSQWYVVWNGTIILTPEKNGAIPISLFVGPNKNTIDLKFYSTNPQYYPLLPIVQLNATSLFKFNNEIYAVPFAAVGYPAYIVDWNGVQWNPLLNEYSQPNFGYAYFTNYFIIFKVHKQVDGFCWGMSSTAILYYLGYLPLPSQGASYTNQLYLGPVNGKGYLEYLTDASLAVAVHEILDPANNVTFLRSLKNANQAEFYIKASNNPVILTVQFPKYYHAVVAWGYFIEPNGDVVFLVYDPNYPQIITYAIYNPKKGSFIYIDEKGNVGEVIAVAFPQPAMLSWFSPKKFKNITQQQVQILQGSLLDYTLYVSTSPLKVYTGGELVGYFIDNEYFVTASTVQPGELAGYVDGPQWSRLYIVAVRNGFNAWVDPNSTLVALRFVNASGTVMVYGFVVNSTGLVAVRFVNQSSFVMASPSSTVVKLELFSVTNSSVKTYNTTLWLSNGTGYAVNANFTNLTNATFKTVTVSWENITQTQTSTATTTTTNAVVITEPAGSSSGAVPIWAVVVDAVAIVIIAISTTILIMSKRSRR